MASPLLLYLKYHKILQPETKCLQTHLNSVDMNLGHLSAKKIIWARRFSAGVDCAGVQEGLTPDGCSDWADVRESSSAWFRMVHAASAAPRTTAAVSQSVRRRLKPPLCYYILQYCRSRAGQLWPRDNLVVTMLHCLFYIIYYLLKVTEIFFNNYI